MLRDGSVSDDAVARFAAAKFELARQGRANRIDRIKRNLDELAHTYDDVVPLLFPDAPSYSEATEIVWPRIRNLIP